MNKKLISESYKEKMKRLSGVKESEKTDLDLLKESYFLSEQEMLNEGIKDRAVALLAALTLVTSSFGQVPSQQVKQDLLNVNLKNKKEVVEFKKDLENRLGDKVNTKDYKDFAQKLNDLASKVGTTQRGAESSTTYSKIMVGEYEYRFNIKNPAEKAKLDELLKKAEIQKGSLLMSNDTVVKMMSVVQPSISTKMKEDIKVNNQSFKGYNVFQVDSNIVKDMANKIKAQFSEYDSVSGYILVHGSASHVPTTAFGGSNEKLAEARACSLATQLEDELGSKFKGKIKVDSKVNGPEYENDKENTAKYAPYQFSNVEIDLSASKPSKEEKMVEDQIIVTVKVLQAGISASDKSVNSGAVKLVPSTQQGKSSASCPIF
jgi:hypothetical protein